MITMLSKESVFVCDMMKVDSRLICPRLRLWTIEFRDGMCRSGGGFHAFRQCAVFIANNFCYLVRGIREFEIPNKIQPREYSRGGGKGGSSHISSER